MKREARTMPIDELRGAFVDIEFPEYQREPDVWSRDQKQRLIDSILRQFDIASIYLYRREDDVLECIDGRQRLNAIMSFLGKNEPDGRDNGFALRSDNEISSQLPNPYASLDGSTFKQLQERRETDQTSREAVESILDYELTIIELEGVSEPDEFNLQFLRLNLGTLINAGEKLNAMVGAMRNLLFEPDGVGTHPFFDRVGIPTRRYAKQLTAAQVLLQAFSHESKGQFARARHFDLQKFVKEYADVGIDDPVVQDVLTTLDHLDSHSGDLVETLRNRAITVTLVLFVWEKRIFEDERQFAKFTDFANTFMTRLRWQVRNMKSYSVDDRYGYLVEFQRHLTQASVEKPAVTRRHEIFNTEFEQWLLFGKLTGDAEYERETGDPPPAA